MAVETKTSSGAKLLDGRAHDRQRADLAILQRGVMNYTEWHKAVEVTKIM